MGNFFGKNLKALRIKAGFSQERLGSQLKKGQKTIGNWETGYSEPSIDELVEISNIFGVTTEELIKNEIRNVNLNAKENTKENVNLNVNPSVNLKAKNREMSVVSESVELYKSNKGRVYDLSSNAAAGLPAILQDDDNRNDLPFFSFPELGAGRHIRIRITGDSMDSTIRDGDYVIASEVMEVPANIRGGAVYVFLDKDDGIVCKRLYVRENNYLELVSDNPIYDSYKRHIGCIQSIFKVVQVHSSNLNNHNVATHKEMQSLRKEIAEIQRQMQEAVEAKKK